VLAALAAGGGSATSTPTGVPGRGRSTPPATGSSNLVKETTSVTVRDWELLFSKNPLSGRTGASSPLRPTGMQSGMHWVRQGGVASQSWTSKPSMLPSLSEPSLVTRTAPCSSAVQAMTRSKSLFGRPRRSTSARMML